ncbi:MAG: NAD-glutamate dehydrogenase [Rhabdochlamydiaceae bacterium]|jgi:glutamate dehydrogenase
MTDVHKQHLQEALKHQSKKFEEYYLWMQDHLPPSFFEDADPDTVLFIAHTLIGFDHQDFFTQFHFKNRAIALSLDSPDADLTILKHYRNRGIKNYRTFVSNVPPPFIGIKQCLRVTVIYFTEFYKESSPLSIEKQQELFEQLTKSNVKISQEEYKHLLEGMDPRFVRSLTKDRLVLAFEVLLRARQQDPCQYEVRFNEDWEKKKETPSLQIVLAWKNVPKYDFLHRLAKVVRRHGLAIKRMAATYINPYSKQSILVMSLGLHGIKGKAAWEEADIEDFLQELVTVKYFPGQEIIETTFVDSGLIRGNLGNLVKTMAYFIHQALVHSDMNLYSFPNIEEALCRHPELTIMLTEAFEWKFHLEKNDLKKYAETKEKLVALVEQLDTGQPSNDIRRKNVLKQGLNFIDFMLKTNFYCKNKTAFSFRLDPNYLNNLPYNRVDKFPEIPFGLFFIKGMYYIGFHIRFRDLARGGLRTVYPERVEQLLWERNNIFSECYNLAFTQQKKNKDIPEGGAKAVILLEPYERIRSEEEIYKNELERADTKPEDIAEKLKIFAVEQKLEYLYQSQRSFVEALLKIVNCNPDGTLKTKHLIDYYQKTEYLYLGPDENMQNPMITWISNYAKEVGYKPGTAFMSSKPGAGINHKEFGVTSCGVNVYMEEVLKHLGIDPTKTEFTIKISGGPDGDVAGNQMYNLYRYYPKTAKLIATIDASGTIYDPKGLDLAIIADLFKTSQPINCYPPEKLSDDGFLVNIKKKREESAYTQQTLCLRKQKGKVVEEWLSGNEMNHLMRFNILQAKTDIFIPGGGRPRTLNETNYKDFLDKTGIPSSKAIVEGANLYLTPGARVALEDLGVVIIKDSSANKGGVICSSFEVLAGLILDEKEFMAEKPTIVDEILDTIRKRSQDEAKLLLQSHGKGYLTQISDEISTKINKLADELLAYLIPLTLPSDPKDPLIHCILNYALPILRKKYAKRMLENVPDVHKKAIIASFLAQRLVYRQGLAWAPSVVEILPLIVSDPTIIDSP